MAKRTHMQPEIHVAAVQMMSEPLAPDANREKLAHLAHEAGLAGADLVVFPELCNTGYLTGTHLADREAFYEAAESIPGPTTQVLGQVARQHNMYVVAGLAERDAQQLGVLFNTAVMLDRQGEVAGCYRKIHLAADEKHIFYRGAKASIFQTELGNIGLMICYDSLFPELGRGLALLGADVVCVAFNWVKVGDFGSDRLKHLIATRALENRTFFVAAGKVGGYGEDVYLGVSLVTGPSGEVLAEATDQGEKIVSATLRSDSLLRDRLSWTPLRDRRPEAYGEWTTWKGGDA
jgi:predicted amidohydrolase